MTTGKSKLSNQLVQLGRGEDMSGRSVNLPIHISSTMLFDTLSAFEEARDARYQHGTLYYGRYGNPASFELEKMMATLEGGYGCIAVSSGLAAVTIALTGFLEAGDHLLVADNVYEPTRSFCNNVLARYGVEVTYFDPNIGAGVAAEFRKNTKALMFEAPGSGTFEVPDIPAITSAATANGIVSVLDGTWATPAFCQPLKLGVDVVVHSGSKYIGGHADCMIGFIVANEAQYLTMRKSAIAFGEKPGAQEVFLALRGLRTLAVRMSAAEQAGLTIARWLERQPAVLKILHPAFPDCPGNDYWQRDFSGAAGLFSVIIKPCSDANLQTFIDSLQMFHVGVSWGGFESLVLPVSPNRTVTPWTHEGRVVRFNIGLENTDSLIEDLSQALSHLD